VPAEAFSQLETIKSTHKVIPLNVIENGHLVSPENVQNVLRNALVEVTFSIEYFQYHSDSMIHGKTMGNVQQIVVLEQST